MSNSVILQGRTGSDIPWDKITNIVKDIIILISSGAGPDQKKEAKLIGDLLTGAITALKDYFDPPSSEFSVDFAIPEGGEVTKTNIDWDTVQDLFQNIMDLIVQYAPDDKKKILGFIRDSLNGLLTATKNYFDPEAHITPVHL